MIQIIDNCNCSLALKAEEKVSPQNTLYSYCTSYLTRIKQVALENLDAQKGFTGLTVIL